MNNRIIYIRAIINLLSKVSLLFVLSCFVSMGYAQTMTVTEFKYDENDLTANTAGTIVLDQNGDKCALIKIESTEFGFSFDVGSLGVVKTEQHTGEVWVYVPEGVKRISISHPKLEKIRDYDLGLSVKKARTYVMRLSVQKPISEEVSGMGTIDVKVTPIGAEVFIDDISVGKSPISFSKLIPGKHKVTIKHEGYFDYESNINIAENKVSVVEEELAKSCDIDRSNNRITITTKGVTFSLVKVEGGRYQMGATPEQGKAKTDEYPLHYVTLSDYYIGETEVTNELWTAIMNTNPSVLFSQPLQPVNNITWFDCQKFINRLSSLTGLRFALPTEAQWEYAARGGKNSRNYKYSGSNNIKDVAWYKGNAKGGLQEVKKLKPNELGIYDMSGNAYEWCSDWYGLYKADEELDPKGPSTGTFKVKRSGSAGEKDALTRIAFRIGINPNQQHQGTSFRIIAIE